MSLDPISLMQMILAEVAEQSQCPRKEHSYRVFDGKRRYLAILGGAPYGQFRTQSLTKLGLP